MRSVQRRSLSELLLPQKFPELERFFWGKKRTESFLFPFLISKKKNSLFLQLWNHPLESERHTHTESTMMILINWKKKKKKQRPKVETISHRTAAATTDCNSSGCQEERRICDCQKQ
jgi:hypothetical protein